MVLVDDLNGDEVVARGDVGSEAEVEKMLEGVFEDEDEAEESRRRMCCWRVCRLW